MQRETCTMIGYDNGNNYWPRKAAYKIIMLESRKEMLEAIDQVPNHFQDWVKFYLNNWIERAGTLTELRQNIAAANEKLNKVY